MTLAFADRSYLPKTYTLPRQRGETKVAYAYRFFREIRGLGHVALYVVRGNRRRLIAKR